MPELHKAGVAYSVAIAHFFYQSSGFTKFYNELYAYWKCTPLLVLISFLVLHGGRIPLKTRAFLAIALTCGCAGDYVIGIAKEGIVPGAILFGVGHVFYLMTFLQDGLRINYPLAVFLLIWNVIMGYVCILPIILVSPLAVAILTVYSVLLTSTLIFSASQCIYGTSTHPPGSINLQWRLLGFALFFLSDNVLILAHTGYRVPFAEVIILSTYFASQYFLIRAAISTEKMKKC